MKRITKVKDLIKELSKLNPNAPITIACDDRVCKKSVKIDYIERRSIGFNEEDTENLDNIYYTLCGSLFVDNGLNLY